MIIIIDILTYLDLFIAASRDHRESVSKSDVNSSYYGGLRNGDDYRLLTCNGVSHTTIEGGLLFLQRPGRGKDASGRSGPVSSLDEGKRRFCKRRSGSS